MKKLNLLFTFLLAFFFQLHAQNSLHSAAFENSANQSAANLNPFQSHINRDNFILPQKRNLFSPSNYVWKWDTMICYDASSVSIPFRRVSRSYNLLGEPLTQLTEQLPQGNLIWVNLTNETYTYDSEGHELSYLIQVWQNNAWVNFTKQEMTYNANGDNTDFKGLQWQSNRWVNGIHYSWHFDSNGLCETGIYQSGIQDTLWVNYERWDVAYDINSSMTSEITSFWLNNGWEANFLDTFINDTNVYGNHLTDLRQVWVNNSWVNSLLWFFTHDTAGNYLSTLTQQWQNNSWVNSQYDTSTFNSAGQKTTWLDQYWSNGSWVNSGLTLYVYDTSNNLLSETFKLWLSSQWVNQNKEQYTYDLWGNSMTGKYQTWGGSGWIPNDGTLLVFADHQIDENFTLQNIYQYSAIIDSIVLFVEPNRSKPQITLFPNPAHTMVYVYSDLASTDPYGSLTIYDLRGQFVLSKQLVNETTGIDISGLKTGLYFVRFLNNQLTKTIKLVKE